MCTVWLVEIVLMSKKLWLSRITARQLEHLVMLWERLWFRYYVLTFCLAA